MSRSASGLVRAGGALSVAVALGLGSLAAFAQTAPASNPGGCSTIDFQLGNPAAGARVETGSSIVQGIARATDAPSGTNGIDRVDFFLGSRDEGGMILGSAAPGMTAGPAGPGSFQATLDFPTDQTGGHDLVAYAHSAITGQQSVISVPIALGEDVNKAFVTPPTEATMMCIGSPTGMAATTSMTPASTTTTMTTAPSTTMTPSTTGNTTTTMNSSASASSIVLEVGNPSPGDTILSGAYNMVGRAFDKTATSGSGIDRVDVFLDSRDEGGLFLGEASIANNNLWSLTVTLPNNNLGLHNLTVYAHSSVSGAQQTQVIPITVAQ
jgi:hypothetical protein